LAKFIKIVLFCWGGEEVSAKFIKIVLFCWGGEEVSAKFIKIVCCYTSEGVSPLFT
jgi:hypothetical protein